MLKEIILKLTEKIDVRQIIGAIAILFLFIVLLPEKAVLYIKGMDYGIGYLGIFSIGFLLISFFIYLECRISKAMEEKRIKKEERQIDESLEAKYKNEAENLDYEEKRVLMRFYESGVKAIKMCIDDPPVAGLLNRGLLLVTSHVNQITQTGRFNNCHINTRFKKYLKFE
ncbi:MAG: superinfection exclusion B family protein [Fibromonadales bacterium]|nr:superinfection exclusion B family protein [Fibromonadales bacterium]